MEILIDKELYKEFNLFLKNTGLKIIETDNDASPFIKELRNNMEYIYICKELEISNKHNFFLFLITDELKDSLWTTVMNKIKDKPNYRLWGILENTQKNRERINKKIFKIRNKLVLKDKDTIYKVVGESLKEREMDHSFVTLMTGVMDNFIREVSFIIQENHRVLNKFLNLDLLKGKNYKTKLMDIFEKSKEAKENTRDILNKINEKEIYTGNNKIKITELLSPILLLGETGTGKTLIAKQIKSLVGKAGDTDKNWKISIPNLASDDQFDNELFGYIEGTYTEVGSKVSPLIENICSVIFFDEIGELTQEQQKKLLVFLDDYRCRIKGVSSSLFPLTPVIIIAATNKDLNEMVKNGKFREDLYYRFVHKLEVPNLEKRIDDIPMLIDFIMQSEAINPFRQIKKYPESLISDIEKRIKDGKLKGNFRELETIIKDRVKDARFYMMDRID